MNTAENPSRNNENEVEKFDASPVSSETEFKSYKIMDDKEKEFFIASEKAKIQELRGQLVEKFEDTRDPQERQEAPVEVHPPKKQESGFGKKMKKWMMTLGFMGAVATGSAKSTETNPEDSLKQNTSIDFNNARKVNKIAEDYTKIKKDNKTYGYKVTPGKQIEPAKPSENKGGPEYEKWLIDQVKSGISPQQLADNGYISPENTAKYDPFYKAPSSDIVYIESESGKEVKENPFAAFAEQGEILFSPNKHAAAEMFYPVRKSSDIKDGGMLNTSQQDVLIRFRNDFGFTGEYTIVKSEDLPKIFAGNRYFQSDAELAKLKANASKITETTNGSKLVASK
ncbi:MAG: hypothetical protein KBB91_01185 [Candidatus Pacebacteria bacterium]|nr:hypothetical protein [Candidatus Paceibacterota bacterium]MBP9700993.1 hypothetical protein [Candidatus Paceibacterota bacterium]